MNQTLVVNEFGEVGAVAVKKEFEQLLTQREVCEILQISARTFYRLVTSRRLPAIKVGRDWRVDPTRLRRFLNLAA